MANNNILMRGLLGIMFELIKLNNLLTDFDDSKCLSKWI